MTLNNKDRQTFDEYIKNRFENAKEISRTEDDSLGFWENIINYALIFGYADAINNKICPGHPTEFESPEKLNISIHESFAGKIAVISLGNTKDFENFCTNLAYGGVRPDNLANTGAAFIHGKKVNFIIASNKPYSNVTAKEIGLDEEDWLNKSRLIRLEHESTHFFTKKTYGITNNILHDEVMADFMGIYEAFGYYKAELFLRFMGIIKGSGNRLGFYTKDLSDDVKSELANLTKDVAYSLEKWSLTNDFLSMTKAERIKYMCKAGLSGLLKQE